MHGWSLKCSFGEIYTSVWYIDKCCFIKYEWNFKSFCLNCDCTPSTVHLSFLVLDIFADLSDLLLQSYCIIYTTISNEIRHKTYQPATILNIETLIFEVSIFRFALIYNIPNILETIRYLITFHSDFFFGFNYLTEYRRKFCIWINCVRI